jgi:hypothetical protein
MDIIRREDLINIRTMNIPPQGKSLLVDKLVSKIVGKPIYTINPKLINLIIKWKKEKGDSDSPDNWIKDPKKIEELKNTL